MELGPFSLYCPFKQLIFFFLARDTVHHFALAVYSIFGASIVFLEFEINCSTFVLQLYLCYVDSFLRKLRMHTLLIYSWFMFNYQVACEY